MWYWHKFLLSGLTTYTFMFASVQTFAMNNNSTEQSGKQLPQAVVDKQSELLKLLSQFDQSLNELEERIELHNVIDQRQRRAFNNHFDQFMKTVKRHDKVVTQHSIPQEKKESQGIYPQLSS